MESTRFLSLMRPRSSLQKSLKNTVRDFQTTRTIKPSQGQATNFAHPTPFSARVQKLASKPFRRSYNENHFHSQASYASAKTAVRSLLVLNTGVFGAWWWASNSRDAKLLRWLDENVTLSERNLAAGRYHTLITNAFSHVGLPHFAFNMFALYTFGGMLAMVPGIGATHIWGLALTSSIASSSALIMFQRSKKKPQKQSGLFDVFGSRDRPVREVAMGASGVVMATAAVATCLRPMNMMIIFPVPVPMPLFVATGLFAALDLYMINANDSIGHSAHLGGFAYGVVYYFLLLRNRGGVWRMLSRR